MRKITISILAIFILANIISITNFAGVYKAHAINGSVDLTDYDFGKKKVVDLDGQWELFKNNLLSPEELKNMSSHTYLTIPGDLKSQLNGQTTGYMTLRLRIKAKDGVVYGLRISKMLSASKVWINGVLQGTVGKIGKSYEAEKAIYLPTYSYFTSNNGEVEIVIETSNYRDLFPIIRSMQFSTKDNIMNEFLLNVSVDLVILGSLLVLELLNLFIFKKVKGNKASLYFSILCLLVQLRCLFLNERIIIRFFPNMPYELMSKTAALTYYLWIPIYVLFIREIFKDIPKKLTVLSLGFSLLFSFICIVTEGPFYDSLSYIGEGFLALIIISMLIFLVNKVIKKERYSGVSLLAFIFIIATALNDVLVNNGVSYSRYGFQIGMFMFAILETYVIAIRYSDEVAIIEKLKVENKIIYENSIRDGLTKLYNRDYIDSILDIMIEDYKKYNSKFSVLMIDVDFFKAINDKFGHPYGDEVLINVSKAIENSLRPTDYAGRYGGEEFIVILPNTNKEKAKEISETIRQNIKDIYLKNGDIVTVSGGLYENDTYIKQQCIENADKLLYIAKNAGRDRIAV
ncbi:diguanylate cyclase [Clostridium manihotivorum]|uniref:Diguanylate cyclase n=1 Tax=Clostridium manihotivorum TaxID=2320868 RepID=A0A3R5QR36_9CLOT|nr:diguanylate cyclase [Clostridium manihotivorum]QAA30501.1 diguanylate cyclase [Clostridium manihotivorum]